MCSKWQPRDEWATWYFESPLHTLRYLESILVMYMWFLWTSFCLVIRDMPLSLKMDNELILDEIFNLYTGSVSSFSPVKKLHMMIIVSIVNVTLKVMILNCYCLESVGFNFGQRNYRKFSNAIIKIRLLVPSTRGFLLIQSLFI